MIILQALFYALPIYLANMAPVFAKGVPFLNFPLDGGKMLKGERLFGENKTWRGLFAGTIMAMLVIWVQAYLYGNFEAVRNISVYDYSRDDVILFGALLGFGAILGDALKSFIKRRFGIKSGRPFVPFDQLDFIIGALALGAIVFFPSWGVVITLIVVTPALHWLSNVIAFRLKLKDVPW